MKKKLFLIVFLHALVYAKIVDLGVHGELFDIVEKNLYEDIKERSTKVDYKGLTQQLKKSIKEKMFAKNRLPSCKENKQRTKVIMYTLKRDVVGGNGIPIYKKGYTFNVVEKLLSTSNATQKPLFFFNVEDPIQVRLAEKQDYPMEFLVVYGDLEKTAKMGIEAYLTDGLENTFDVKCLPSIVKFEKDHIIIQEKAAL